MESLEFTPRLAGSAPVVSGSPFPAISDGQRRQIQLPGGRLCKNRVLSDINDDRSVLHCNGTVYGHSKG